MKFLKTLTGTIETIGHVVYSNDDSKTLPAFVSIIKGELRTLRIGDNISQVTNHPNDCVTYNLDNQKDIDRLADSDITEIHYSHPSWITIERQPAIKESLRNRK